MCDTLTTFNEVKGSKAKLISITNNASWWIGHLVMKAPESVSISLEPVYKELTAILTAKVLNKGLAQNVSLCIGKLGWVDPKSGTDYLKHFIKPWCISLRYLTHSLEKQQSYAGVWEIIKQNPKAVLDSFDFLCEAFAEYQNSPTELTETFKNILQGYKTSAGDNWSQFFNAFPSDLQEKLIHRFGL